jgi:predicted MFS family arabinose efflux permease
VVPWRAASWRNVAILASAQALAASAGPFITLAGGIIGESLAPSRLLATLPITALIIGLACAAVPVALLIRRVGRRTAFIIGAAVSATGALLAARATRVGSFATFCAATFVMGAAGACVQQYRFAAAESVDERHTGRAVSLLLVGGIIAGVLGPEIGRRGRGWFGNEFSGAFVIVAIASCGNGHSSVLPQPNRRAATALANRCRSVRSSRGRGSCWPSWPQPAPPPS